MQWAEFESAYLSIAPGDLDKAAEAMRAGLEVNRRGGYPHFAAYYIAHLGWLARLRGDDEEAMTLGRRAVDIAEQHELPWWQATACAMLGGTLLQAGNRAAATALFERGLTAAQQAGAEAYLLHCTAPLAAAAGSPAVLADADDAIENPAAPVRPRLSRNAGRDRGLRSRWRHPRHGGRPRLWRKPVQSRRRHLSRKPGSSFKPYVYTTALLNGFKPNFGRGRWSGLYW